MLHRVFYNSSGDYCGANVMRFRVMPVACLIVLFLSPIGLSVNVVRAISNLPQEQLPYAASGGLTRHLQQVPAQIALFQAVHAGPCLQGSHIKSCLQSVALSGASPDTPPPTNWDEQLGLSFTQNFTSLAYNVTAIEQSDVDGYGPAYLLNGLTDIGYWYQVGLSWDWTYLGGGYDSGFHLDYEVFNSEGSSIFPSLGSGLVDFSGTVNQGDTVLLTLYFSRWSVIMQAYDFNTGASAQESYSAEGATTFVGTPFASLNSNGFFTGLMTEWWHVSEYFGNEASVLYSDSTFALYSAWMWIDEWNPTNGTSIFSATTTSPSSYSSPTQLQYFSSNGATEASDAFDFITGTANLVPLTLSYSVIGGGFGYASPTLTYSVNDAWYLEDLTTSPTTYYADPGSVWNTSDLLSGSSSTEVWSSNELTSGIANSSQTINIGYYHQFLVNLQYNISGTDAGCSPPIVIIEQFGTPGTVIAPDSVFIDAWSQYLYRNPLPGSNSTMRWETPTASGTVSSSTTISPIYYVQYSFTISYSISGGSGYSAPALYETQFGDAYALALTTTPMPYWLDSGTSWSVDNTLSGSGNSERWMTTTATSGTVDSQSTLSPMYYHQYALTASYSIIGGGNSGPPTVTGTSLGNTLSTTIALGAPGGTIWLDADSTFSIPNLLPFSSSTERWYSQSPTSSAMYGPTTIYPVYYHQYLVFYSYSIDGGGNPTPPILNGTYLGTSVNLALGRVSKSVWLDSMTNYAFNSSLNASITERWFTNQSLTYGTVSSSTTFFPAYVHQFYLYMESDAVAGGSISPASSWVNASQQIQISAAPSSGWQFESWHGSGSASYSGALSVTTVAINSPMVEYATFYPGLTIDISNYGTLTYSYGSGSYSMPSHSLKVMYVPLNSNVSFTANPSSYIFQFKQWSGTIKSTAQQITLMVAAPTLLQASFDFNWFSIVVTIAVIGGSLAVLAELILQRRKTRIARQEIPRSISNS